MKNQLYRWLLIGGFCVLVLYPVAASYSTIQEVDLSSGTFRKRWMVLQLNVYTKTEETWLSRTVDTQYVRRWRTVKSTCLFNSVSPHFAYHRAKRQVDELTIIFQQLHFSPDAKRMIANNTINLWIKSTDDSLVDAYLTEISERVRLMQAIGRTEFRGIDLPN